MCVLFSVPVLVACSSQKGMYYSNNDGGASNIYERFNHSGPPASIESMDRMNYMMTSAESRAYSEDEKKAYGEYSHVCKLERSASPQHQQELEQLRNRLVPKTCSPSSRLSTSCVMARTAMHGLSLQTTTDTGRKNAT